MAGQRFLRAKEVKARVGLSVRHILRLEELGQFPKSVRVTFKSRAWVESEIDKWIDDRISVRDGGDEGRDSVIAATAGKSGGSSAGDNLSLPSKCPRPPRAGVARRPAPAV